MTLFQYSWILFSFSATAVSAVLWLEIPAWIWLVPSIIAILSIRFKYRQWWFVIGILLGVILIILHGNALKLQTNVLFQSSENITIKGQVDSSFKQISYGYEGSFVVRSINGQTLNYLQRPTIRILTPIKLQLDDVAKFQVTIKPIYGQLNEAGFDQESYYVSQRLVAKAVVKANSVYMVHSQTSMRSWLLQRVESQIERLPNFSLIMALAFGERDDISNDLWEKLKNSGLIHLVAISGLHIGIAYSIGYFVGKVCRLFHSRWLWLPVFMAINFAYCYAWLAGFTLPTQRAFLMCLILSLCLLSRVQFSSWLLLLTTLAIVLTVNPFAALSNSFWMSFGAVIAIYLALSKRPTQSNVIITLIFAQLYLLIFMTPITIFFFGGMSVSSALYNLFFVPWFSLVVVPLLFACLMLTVVAPSFSDEAWWAVDKALELMIWAIQYADLTWLSVSREVAQLILYLTLLFTCSTLFSGRVNVLLLAVYLSWVSFNDDDLRWRMDILDVGHGLAIVIEKEGKAILYDTGKAWIGGSIVESVVHPVLTSRGISGIDGLILSHLDSDHAGGRYQVESKLSPLWRRASQNIEGYQSCKKGDHWQWQGLMFDVVWPPKQVSRSFNPHSCVIRISDERSGVKVLLTGDVDAVSEWILRRNPDLLASDIMIVPHHGSITSSTMGFLNAIKPQLAVASLDKGSRWKMPADQVLANYQKIGSDWLDTGHSGQVSLFFYSNGWKVRSLRGEGNQAWYRQMLRKGVE
ncbi:DNA internalization-related competence protein ComEC/Rec2 [Vibrio cortegadensis]|uniref:DNA internalization-related competence protein ComEC/Rec2 n=1 Tax=Vibrio cortegadensis TaxID=1328770 RepID=UPI0021C4B24E|nr:DNA internalization-related competence protein ComEC/Rec2 [Vibrio cortegadensis]